MFTSIDKALVALIGSVVFLFNSFTGFHFGVDPGVVAAVVGVATPLLTYLTPNKAE